MWRDMAKDATIRLSRIITITIIWNTLNTQKSICLKWKKTKNCIVYQIINLEIGNLRKDLSMCFASPLVTIFLSVQTILLRRKFSTEVFFFLANNYK